MSKSRRNENEESYGSEEDNESKVFEVVEPQVASLHGGKVNVNARTQEDSIKQVKKIVAQKHREFKNTISESYSSSNLTVEYTGEIAKLKTGAAQLLEYYNKVQEAITNQLEIIQTNKVKIYTSLSSEELRKYKENVRKAEEVIATKEKEFLKAVKNFEKECNKLTVGEKFFVAAYTFAGALLGAVIGYKQAEKTVTQKHREFKNTISESYSSSNLTVEYTGEIARLKTSADELLEHYNHVQETITNQLEIIQTNKVKIYTSLSSEELRKYKENVQKAEEVIATKEKEFLKAVKNFEKECNKITIGEKVLVAAYTFSGALLGAISGYKQVEKTVTQKHAEFITILDKSHSLSTITTIARVKARTDQLLAGYNKVQETITIQLKIIQTNKVKISPSLSSEEVKKYKENIQKAEEVIAREEKEFLQAVKDFEKECYKPTVGQKVFVAACTFAGALLGAVIGYVAGAFIGGLVGGTVGSVIPGLGTVVGAAVAGNAAGVVAAAKSLDVGTAIGAGVALTVIAALNGYDANRAVKAKKPLFGNAHQQHLFAMIHEMKADIRKQAHPEKNITPKPGK